MNETTEPEIICDCTDTRPFPQPFESISLTNYVELIKVDELYNPNHNGFEIIRQVYQMPDIKHMTAVLSIYSSKYDAYLATPQMNGFKLTKIDFHSEILRNTIYFFINKKFSTKPLKVLQERIYEIWRERTDANFQGNVYHKSTPNRFPFIMPSRGKIFR